MRDPGSALYSFFLNQREKTDFSSFG